MTPPRLQFTLRGMLWATFWVAVWLAALSTVITHRAGYGWLAEVNELLVWLCPFVAVGALFGRARRGLFVGATGLVMLYFLAILLFLFLIIRGK